jgi:hypothetical protein
MYPSDLPPAFAYGRVLPAFLALALCACAPSKYRFGNLESRYESPSLPLHFATGRDGFSLSLYGNANGQGVSEYRREFIARASSDRKYLFLGPDSVGKTSFMTFEDRMTAERDAWLVGGAATWEDGILYSGLTGGASLDGPGDWHAGVFVGLSPAFDRVVPSIGLSLTRNHFHSDGEYWKHYSDDSMLAGLLDTLLDFGNGPGPTNVYVRDADGMERRDWEVRFSAGLMYRLTRRFAPYARYEGGWVRLWPADAGGGGHRAVTLQSYGGGLEFRIRESLPLRAELGYGEAYIPDRFETRFWVAGLTAEKEF